MPLRARHESCPRLQDFEHHDDPFPHRPRSERGVPSQAEAANGAALSLPPPDACRTTRWTRLTGSGHVSAQQAFLVWLAYPRPADGPGDGGPGRARPAGCWPALHHCQRSHLADPLRVEAGAPGPLGRGDGRRRRRGRLLVDIARLKPSCRWTRGRTTRGPATSCPPRPGRRLGEYLAEAETLRFLVLMHVDEELRNHLFGLGARGRRSRCTPRRWRWSCSIWPRWTCTPFL